MSLRLHIRLTLVIGALLVALTLALGAAIARIAQHYQAEVAQRLNAGVAMYVTNELSLLNERGVNAPALQELARRVMTVNPSAEVLSARVRRPHPRNLATARAASSSSRRSRASTPLPHDA